MPIPHPIVGLQEKIDQIHRAVYVIAAETERLLSAHNLTAVYHCDICSCDIYPGNACVDVTRRVEQLNCIDDQNVIIVIDADCLATFCASCGNQFAHVGYWRRELGQALELSEEDMDVANAEEQCALCLQPLAETGARVEIELMISQVDARPVPHGGAEHTPILSEACLVFCPECGNRMSREKLQEAMNGLLREFKHNTLD